MSKGPVQIRVVAVGDGAVGKTCMLLVFKGDPYPEDYEPTIFENHHEMRTLEGKQYCLHLWDTAGQDEYDRLRPLSYSGANAILLCFALDSKQSFVNLSERWFGEVKHYCKDAKIIVIGTKSDLRQAGNSNHVTDDEARAFVSENKCDSFIPCSPKTGDGVQNVVPAAAKACNQKKKKRGCVLL